MARTLEILDTLSNVIRIDPVLTAMWRSGRQVEPGADYVTLPDYIGAKVPVSTLRVADSQGTSVNAVPFELFLDTPFPESR